MEDTKARQVGVRLDTPTFAKLWAVAQEEGVPVAEVVRRIVMAHQSGREAVVNGNAIAKAVEGALVPLRDEINQARLEAATAVHISAMVLQKVAPKAWGDKKRGAIHTAAADEALRYLNRDEHVSGGTEQASGD